MKKQNYGTFPKTDARNLPSSPIFGNNQSSFFYQLKEAIVQDIWGPSRPHRPKSKESTKTKIAIKVSGFTVP